MGRIKFEQQQFIINWLPSAWLWNVVQAIGMHFGERNVPRLLLIAISLRWFTSREHFPASTPDWIFNPMSNWKWLCNQSGEEKDPFSAAMKIYIVEVNQHRNLNQIRDDFSSLSLIESVFPIRKVFIDFPERFFMVGVQFRRFTSMLLKSRMRMEKIYELRHVRKRLKRADTSQTVRDPRSNPSKKNTSHSYLMAGS